MTPTKCRTLGCTSAQAFVIMSYRMPGMTDDEDPITDELCFGCLNTYARRPAIRIVGVADVRGDVAVTSSAARPEPWSVEDAGATTTWVAVVDPSPLRRFNYFSTIHAALRAREACEIPNGEVFLLDRLTGQWRDAHFDATTFHAEGDEVGLFSRPGVFGTVTEVWDWGRRLLITLDDGKKVWADDDDVCAVDDEDDELQVVTFEAENIDGKAGTVAYHVPAALGTDWDGREGEASDAAVRTVWTFNDGSTWDSATDAAAGSEEKKA